MRISDWSSDVCASDLSAWLNPGFTRNGESVQEKPTAFGQVLCAATSLGAVEADAAMLRLNRACCVASYAAFCDSVHDTLVAHDSAGKDAVVLATFAWRAVGIDRQGAAGWKHGRASWRGGSVQYG